MSFTKEPSFDFSLSKDGIETTFRFEDVGNVPGILNEVGDTGSNEAILFNEVGESVGISVDEFELVEQLTDGAFIVEIEDIFDFGEGNTITVAGELNVEQFEALQPAEVEIVSGEGIFDGAEGKATLAQAELDVLDVIEIDLSLAASGSFLSFTEEIIPSSVEIIDVDGIDGISTIGEGRIFEANWYAPDTDLFDAEPDTVLATKTNVGTVIAQLGNGVVIEEIEETIQFVDGPFLGDEITTKGFIIAGLASSGTITLPIVSGTGNFQNLNGVETVTGDSSMLGISDINLSLLTEIAGTGGDNNLRGHRADEFISGKNGNDTLSGGQGNDILNGDRGGDLIRGGAGDDILAGDRVDHFLNGALRQRPEGTLHPSGAVSLMGETTGHINAWGDPRRQPLPKTALHRFDDDGTNELKGDNGNDTLRGGDKADLMKGGNGDDLLFGQGGDDLIKGGNGFDLLNGGLGDDTLKGQGGIDVADYSDLHFDGISASIAGVDVNLDRHVTRHSSTNNALHSTDTLIEIENVIGTNRNDRFMGDKKDNVFYGLSEIGKSDRHTEFVSGDGELYQVDGDVVEYDGELAEFTFGESEALFAGLTVTADEVGTDILIDIEFLKFDDVLISTDSI